MLRLVVCLSVLSLAVGQSGTNYQTGDGQSRSESVDPQGNVKGQYSYVDPNGKTISVKYSAGKNGFQVEGDHIPRSAGTQGLEPLRSAPYQIPTGPRDFPPYQPTAQDGQYQLYNQGAPQPQYNQQGLFAPTAAAGFGQVASQGQIAQYSQEQAAQLAEAQRAAAQQYTPQATAPQYSQPPPTQYSQSPQLPASTQYSDPSQYSPALSTQQLQRQQFAPTAPQQFTQEQLAQLSQNQAVQQQLAELSRAQNGQQQLTQEQLIRLSQQQQTGQPQLPQQQTTPQQSDSQAQLAQRQQLALIVQQQQAQIAQQRAGQAEYRPQQEAQQQQLALLAQQQGGQPQLTPQQLAQYSQQQQQQYTPQQIAQLRQAGAGSIPTPSHRFSPTGAASTEQGAYNYQFGAGQ